MDTTGAPDNKRIDVRDPNELRHEQLKEAVARVGTSVDKVRESLRNC